VDAVNGAFMLIRREALDEVGLFDEGYWMYMEDLDLCWRFKQAGWQTWFEPSVTAIHGKGGSAGSYRSLRLNYAFHYGMFRFYRSHSAPERNPLLNAAVYAGIAVKLAASVVRNTFHLGGPPHGISRHDAVVPGAETASEPPVPAHAGSDDDPPGIGAAVR
jgi:GT2 family glycosyltransferase